MTPPTPTRPSDNGTMTPASTSRSRQHDLLLLFIIFFVYPFTTATVSLTSLYSSLPALPSFRKKQVPAHTTPRKKIIITGASTPLALALAHILHAEGHTILAADYESFYLASPARLSPAVTKFYRLGQSLTLSTKQVQKGNAGASVSRLGSISHTPSSAAKGASEAQRYARDLEAIVHHAGGVDLWIPCDQDTPHAALAAAREVILKSGGAALYPDPKCAQLSADEAAFAECVRALEGPIKAPERRIVTTRGEVHRILHHSPKGRQYVLEKIQPAVGVEEKPRLYGNGKKRDSATASMESSPTSSSSAGSDELFGSSESLILPRPSMNETYSTLAKSRISTQDPWILHEVMADTGMEVCTHSLVVNKTVKTFIATSSTNLTTTTTTPDVSASSTFRVPNYGAIISSTSALHSTLLAFTTSFVATLPSSTSTHLSLTFHLHETPTATGTATIVIPRSCSTTPHPSLALLLAPCTDSDQIQRVAAAYISAASPNTPLMNGARHHGTTPVTLSSASQSSCTGLYSLPQLVLDSLVLPTFDLLLFRTSIAQNVASVAKFSEQLVFGTEERWAWGNAASWWWQWHVAFPVEVLSGAQPKVQSTGKSVAQ